MLQMALSFLQGPIPSYFETYLGKPDERVTKWILLNSPGYTPLILLAYFVLIRYGTRLMKNRKPMDLRKPLILYNTCQVALSGYICIEIFLSAYLAEYDISCTQLDTSDSILAVRMARGFWFFYLSKVIDLIDTVFLVLRKRNMQLSFLHWYHHGSMIFNWYLGVLYLPGGQAFFSVLLNSFVHVIMYTYYLLSAMGPKMHKYLWWKKYLTQIQMIQFVMVMTHIGIGYRCGCNTPFWLICFTVTYLWTLIFLFTNFYIRAYNKKSLRVTKQRTIFKYSISNHEEVDDKAGGDRKND